jgi:excisionase family DNA binding protein
VSTTAASLSDWLTTKEVAAYYGVPTKTVLRMIREQRLPAEQKGWIWLVHIDNLPREWPPPKSN